MQRQSNQPKPAAKSEQPPSHEHTNRPGMTNGVPDQAHEGEAAALPHDERHDAEKAAAEHGGKP